MGSGPGWLQEQQEGVRPGQTDVGGLVVFVLAGGAGGGELGGAENRSLFSRDTEGGGRDGRWPTALLR